MILSVSRRTDIPAFYSEWFLNRIKEGYVYVQNPFNIKQISKVNIMPEVVDGIVFWSKDPLPLMKDIKRLKEYNYYFQFTITPYDNDIEQNIRSKKEIVNTFISLSELIGKERVILRYDPILLTDKYSIEFHKRSFEKLCERVSGYTNRIVISYLDDYKKVSRNMKELNIRKISTEQAYQIGKFISEIAQSFGINVESCAEEYDLEQFGINHGKCIDGELIEKISGYKLKSLGRDGNRQLCLCDQCIDIGQYDSCIHGCLYCYANANKEIAKRNYLEHSVDLPILVGEYDEMDVKARKDVCSWRLTDSGSDEQIRMNI